jgi:chromosome partitioning protein
MLGDVDKQRSTQSWLRLREAQCLAQRAPIVGWAMDPHNVLRPPAGIGRVVLDTPGGLRGSDLARVVMYADAILMPVCNSMFDRTSAADCHAELKALPRVASGRCKVAAVGMRLDARTKAVEVVQQWAERLELPFLGALREAQSYVRCIEQGLTLFDMPADKVQADLVQWQPILDWLEPILRQPILHHPAQPASPVRAPLKPPTIPRVSPAEGIKALEEVVTRRVPSSSRRRGLLDWLALPRLFQRNS